MPDSFQDAHARFRFSVVGPLLSAPPEAGDLRAALKALAERTWKHPTTGEPTRYSFSTIERWYYLARFADNPVRALRPRARNDSGQHRSISAAFARAARAQYRNDPHWTWQLHHDNLRVLVEKDPTLGPLPSYPSFVRYMKATGLVRKKRPRSERPGERRAREHLEQREVRSYEAAHTGALWHLDFHRSSSVAVLTPRGEWKKPELFAVLDDHSRLCCHAQFYFSETAEDLVHGLSQAILKRGLPREILSDNGSAMLAAEFTQGLSRLSILHQTTLAYSPYQNGKQEHFWAVVEGRLMAMLHRVRDLTLEQLNEFLQAWIERDYHRKVHSEIGTSPLERYRNARDVSRDAPGVETLRDAFRQQLPRKQRHSDGTFTLEGTRFEVPSRYRDLKQLVVRYARWDLGNVHLVDHRADKLLARVFPVDRSQNASGRRRCIETAGAEGHDAPVRGDELPPLLNQLLEDYAATGLPPSYLPKSVGDDSAQSADPANRRPERPDSERTD